jgi:DNA-binding NtrC family response regulator
MNSHHRILVVEAEHDFRQLTAEALMDAGYQVETAYDEAGAWAALQVAHYDLLVIAELMPMVSGSELLTQIYFSGMSLPIIMSTDLSSIEVLGRQPSLKTVKLIFKPFSFEELLNLVRYALTERVSAGERR